MIHRLIDHKHFNKTLSLNFRRNFHLLTIFLAMLKTNAQIKRTVRNRKYKAIKRKRNRNEQLNKIEEEIDAICNDNYQRTVSTSSNNESTSLEILPEESNDETESLIDISDSYSVRIC